MSRQRCAIIGGSMSGLVSAKWALEYNIEPTVFEATDFIGGLWLYKEEDCDLPTVMKSTVINSSKECAAFSDFPPPAKNAPYMHHSKFYDYICSYAKHNDLMPHVKLGHRVKNVSKTEDYESTGKWHVTYTDDKGIEQEEVFDAVLSCVGHHTKPNWPTKWPGQDDFQGKFTHAHSYKHSRGYEDKTVVVVGAGNSAMDITCELSRVTKQVYWSTRRGAWVMPKCSENGWPVDMVLTRRIFYYLSRYAPSWMINNYIRSMYTKHFDHELYGIKPSHGVDQQHPTASDEMPIRIASGTVLPKPNIKKFTRYGVEFEDGTVVDDVDEVVFATGYTFDFKFIEEGRLIPVNRNKCRLFKQMYPKDVSEKNTLAVIGLVQPLGSILPVSEIQARLFFDAFVGHTQLPSFQEMERANDDYQAYLKRQFVNSERYTIEINYLDYMNEVGDMMGCSPRPLNYLLSDPRLAYHLIFEAEVPYAFRLRGPHPWNGARKAILETNKRVRQGIHHRDTEGNFAMETTPKGYYIFTFVGVTAMLLIVKLLMFLLH